MAELTKPLKIAFDNSFWSYSFFRIAGLVWLRRSNKKFQSIAEIQESFETLAMSLSSLPRERLRLLVDLRDGPQVRNDPQFEAIMLPYRQELPAKFAKSAVLVRTAVGKLQVNRYNRQDGGLAPGVFDSESEALESLGFSHTPNA